jgi:ABC-2 type transport system permease protein
MSQVARQVGYTNKAFWRNPASAFFAFIFPLLFLVIFTSLLGNDEVPTNGVMIKSSTYYVFSMASFGLISACYTNIAISVVFAREQGVLKRLRGTPLPAGSYLTARVLHASFVGFLLVAITVAFGVFVYGAHFPAAPDLALFVLTLVVGAACFAAIGLAVSGIVPNEDAGPPIVNAVILPLLFLSGVFFSTEGAPQWVVWVGRIFPVKPLVDAMRSSYLGVSFDWSDLLVMAIWLVAAVVVASRTFRWEPGRERGGPMLGSRRSVR